MAAAVEERDLLLQGATPRPLELFVRVKSPNEHHFYARGVSFADFTALFHKDLTGGEALIFRMPSSFLNPNYWEPLTKDSERAVREKRTGIITRQEGDRTLLWRSDQLAKGRLLDDRLDIPVELLAGCVFRTTGDGLLKLASAWRGGTGKLEFARFSKLPSEVPGDVMTVAHNDVTQLRLSLPDETLVFSSMDDQTVRVVFSSRDSLRRAVSAVIRGFVHGITKHHLSYLNDRVLDAVIRVSDGLGLTASPDRDFVNKHRTFEIQAHVGKTEWPAQLKPGQEPLIGDEKVLIYYDRTAGIWAVAT